MKPIGSRSSVWLEVVLMIAGISVIAAFSESEYAFYSLTRSTDGAAVATVSFFLTERALQKFLPFGSAGAYAGRDEHPRTLDAGPSERGAPARRRNERREWTMIVREKERIAVPGPETLDPEVAKVSDAWAAIGSDPSMVRLMSYRSDLVPPFYDFYLNMRGNGLVSAKTKELARFTIAKLNTCRYCLQSLSTLAASQGITNEHVAEIETRTPRLFSSQEIAAMDLAEALWNNASEAGKNQKLMDRLHAEFTDAQIVELTWAIAMYIGLGKMVVFSGIVRDS
jgi:AhpD family alkylhydroperoxidase